MESLRERHNPETHYFKRCEVTLSRHSLVSTECPVQELW